MIINYFAYFWCYGKGGGGLKKYFNPFIAVYKCTQYAGGGGGGGEYGYFDFIMVLHIISYKIITTVGIYTKFFPAWLRNLVQCLK